MSVRSLLKKEGYWSARHIWLIVFLLLILPGFFAGVSFLWQDTLPRDVPVGVTPGDDTVTDDELAFIESGLSIFTDPEIVETEDEARHLLEREEIYATIVVPPGINDPDAEATFTVIVDGRIVPFQDPSEVITGLMENELDDLFDADISTERVVVGDEIELPEYLYPVFLMVLFLFFAFTYVPFNLVREQAVLDRLRVESSLEALAASKLIYLTGLMLLPVLVFHLGSVYYGYAVDSLAPQALLVLAVTFLFLSTLSMTITILTRFSPIGQFVNVVLLLGLAGLSALAFPLGFFSSVRTTIAQLLPTHYAMIMLRSTMLKESSLAVFADWFLGLLALTALALVALKLAIVQYRRSA